MAALPTFRDESAVSTWSYRVALNTAMSWRRSEQARRRRLPVQPGVSPELVSARPVQSRPADLLQRLLEKLAPADKAVLVLFLDDVGYDEMAAILGVAAGALRVRIHRIRKRLAELREESLNES